MAQVTVTINSREYPIACESGQEARIMQLAGILEEKARLLKDISGQISENMFLAMVGILVADDLFEARKNTPRQENIQSHDAALSQTVSAEAFAAADLELSTRLRVVSEKIKAVAKQIESL